MQVLYAYVMHVCYAYSSRMIRILLVAYVVRILRACWAYSSHTLRIILAYDMRILRVGYAYPCVCYAYLT